MSVFSEKKRKTLYYETGGICIYCGRQIPFKESTIDHIVPLAIGGKNEPVNAICSCINCNRKKGDLSIKQFIRKYSKKRRTAYLNRVRCLFEGDKISDEKYCRLLGDFSEEPKTTRLNFKLGRFRLLGRFYVSPVSSL